MAGGVDEGDELVVPGDLVRPDVLGDATGFAGHHVSGTNAVQEQGLAVVDVTHDGDHRRAGTKIGFDLLVLFFEEPGQQFGLLLFTRIDQANLRPEFGREQFNHVVGQ